MSRDAGIAIARAAPKAWLISWLDTTASDTTASLSTPSLLGGDLSQRNGLEPTKIRREK